jgi:hypothetical protein
MDSLAIAQAVVGEHVLLKAEPKPSWKTRPFVLWKPLQDAYEGLVKRYEAHVQKMLVEVNRELGVDKLEKAVTGPLLTPEQIRKIVAIIRDYHDAFVIHMGGTDQIDPKRVRDLIKQGILPEGMEDIIEDAYLYGQLVAGVRELGVKNVKKMSAKQLRAHFAKHPTPLTPAEKNSIEWSRQSAALHVSGLGDRISADFAKVALEADANFRRQFQGEIRDRLAENTAERETVQKLASELGHATGDWSRDFGRIAATEKQQAFQEGFVSKLIKDEGDPKGIYVAKIPKPDACPDCNRLHLTAGPGSAPRVFKLSELIGHGSNRGKKRAAWEAVVGTVHPWCACETVHVPAGWRFEDEPELTEGLTKVKGKKAWMRDNGKPWRPRLLPDPLRRGDVFTRDLMKSLLTYEGSVPETGVAIRIGDPEIVREIEAVVARTPPQLFDKDVGITLITWDHPREGVPLDDHDLAYWTGNEIRIAHDLTADKVQRVIEHEMGHVPNVFLMKKWGGEAPVRAWHAALDSIAKEEGYVTKYAGSAPIECAAEVTRMYLYDRARLRAFYPYQFTFVHETYAEIWRRSEDRIDGGLRQTAV